jgi:hypothetical protein
MMVVPGDTPVATPVPATMVATEVVPLLHVPPASVSAVVNPLQTARLPPIAAGSGLTVTASVITQPLVCV